MPIRKLPKETKACLFYDPPKNRVFVSINVTFLEEDHIRNYQPHNKLILNEISEETTNKSTKVIDKVVSSFKVTYETSTFDQSHPSQKLRVPRCNGRITHQLDHYLSLTQTQLVILDEGVKIH